MTWQQAWYRKEAVKSFKDEYDVREYGTEPGEDC
jgi:hypothetical protein